MLRRRLETPPLDRCAVILGIPSVAMSGARSADVSFPRAGWVPQRSSMAGPLAGVPPAMSAAAGDPGAVAPCPPVSAEHVWAEAGWVPAGSARTDLTSAASARTDLTSAASAPDLDDGRHRRPGPPRPAILTVPLALRGVRARPRRLAVLGLLVLLVGVGVVLGIRVAWARSAATPQAIATAAHGAPGGLVARTVPAAFATTGAPGSPSAAAGAVLMVHVVGQVRRPGVVRLAGGARVLDAVAAAGGAKPSADLSGLNLARVVADGEQIVVPRPGQIVAGAPGPQGVGGGSTSPGAAGGSTAGALVDLNTADASALDSLPGVGPVLSQRILDWRTAHGRFSSVDELGEVIGIGDKLLAQIGPKVKI